jgi:hypothetical protein
MSYYNEFPFLDVCFVSNYTNPLCVPKPLCTSLLIIGCKNKVPTKEALNCYYLSPPPSIVELLSELAACTNICVSLS